MLSVMERKCSAIANENVLFKELSFSLSIIAILFVVFCSLEYFFRVQTVHFHLHYPFPSIPSPLHTPRLLLVSHLHICCSALSHIALRLNISTYSCYVLKLHIKFAVDYYCVIRNESSIFEYII